MIDHTDPDPPNRQSRVDYVYDSWSRLTSETRKFSDLLGSDNQPASWTLSYTYNYAGELKSLTDAFHQPVDQQAGQPVSYTYNLAGELTSVSVPNVTNFLTAMQYRAFGGLKQMDYGNGLRESHSYNTRLQMSQYQLQAGSSTPLMGYEYVYNLDRPTNAAAPNDGRVRYARDLTQSNSAMDRSYSYDQVGRLVTGLSGREARGESSSAYGPYKHDFGYDAFGNLTSRLGTNYVQPYPQPISYSASYANDRNSAWTYNVAGQLVDTRTAPPVGDRQYEWNAAGQVSQAKIIDGSNQVTQTQNLRYDGDRQNLKRDVTEGNVITTTYYIRSSLLSGQVVNEMNEQQQNQRTYLYANGRKVGRQKQGNTYWVSEDAAVVTYVETDSAGAVWSRVQMDALGVVTGSSGFTPGQGGTQNPPPGYYGNPSNAGMGCRLDGAPFPCDWLARLVNSGSAVPCPDNNCEQTSMTYMNGKPQSVSFERFRAYGDGYGGWVPVTASYVGGGVFTYSGERYEWGSSNDEDGVHLKATLYQGHLSRLAEAGFQQQQEGFLIGRFDGFSDEEMKRLIEAYQRITSEGCRKFFNSAVHSALGKIITRNDGRPKTLEGLLQVTTLNRYSPNLTANDVTLPRSYWADVQSHFDQGDIAFTSRYDGRIFLGDNAFHKSDFLSRHFMDDEDADLPGNIVHEFFHRVGFHHGPNFPEAHDIQVSCGEPGKHIGPSNPGHK